MTVTDNRKRYENLTAMKTRKTRSDKKTRIAPYFDDDTNLKLEMLATACGEKKAGLVEYLVRHVINDPVAVENLQKHFEGQAPEAYRIKAVRINKTTVYRLAVEG